MVEESTMTTAPLGAALAALALSSVALPAAARAQVYTAVLSGAAEATPNPSPAGGAAIVTIDVDQRTMRLQTTFADLLGDVTASHIHCCTATAGDGTAGVATQTPTFTGFPLGKTFGAYDHTFDMTQPASYNAAFITANGGTASSAFDALVAGADAGRAYLNIHTSFAPAGEIRGFLAPVPEPSAWALMLAGLVAVGRLAGRRPRP
jgi:hypothetical protein